MAGPSSAQFNQELGNRLFQLAESLGASLLNQVNRIGSDEEIPLYSPDMTYQKVFETAGYGPGAAMGLGAATGILEPGPGDALRLVEALGALGPLMGLSKRIRSASTPTAVTSGTIPTSRLARTPGFSDEDLAIYATGNVMDDPRTAAMVEHLRPRSASDIDPIEVSVYPQQGGGIPNPERGGNVRIKEGSHRTASAAELGWDEVPVEVTYHGGAETEEGAALFDLIRSLMTAGGGGR